MAAEDDVSLSERIRHFFFPALTPKLLIRALLVGVLAYLFFSQVCIPLRIKGHSMEPTYGDGGINLCWRLRYLFSKPRRHDVVAVRLAGNRVMLLKRVVALEGEEVEFRDGKLLVDGKEVKEPYVHSLYHWNLSPRRVERNSVYVVGDNRNMAMESHLFGQTSIERIVGTPLW